MGQITNKMSSKLIAFYCLTLFIAYAFADIAGGANTYLPPNKGYNYAKPTKVFPTPKPPIRRPPGYNPTKPSYPSPGPSKPSYPTQPSYPSPGPSQPSYPSPRPTNPSYPSPGPSKPPHHEDHHHHHEPGMPFDFQYAVNDIETANDYSHKAVSDGDVTRGEYRVQLPDGRTQIVRYTADWRNGFNAEVTYEGQARFPDGPTSIRRQGGSGTGSSQGYRY